MNTLAKRLLISLSLALSLPALALGGPDGNAPLLGDAAAAEAAWPAIEAGALVIDVRSPEEFATGHLDGAINIPHVELDRIVEAIGDDPGRSVVVHCRSGRRSGLVLDALEARGYENVLNAGGLDALLATRPAPPESE